MYSTIRKQFGDYKFPPPKIASFSNGIKNDETTNSSGYQLFPMVISQKNTTKHDPDMIIYEEQKSFLYKTPLVC